MLELFAMEQSLTTDPARRTQRERREQSYRKIMDTAIKLIARQGSSRTTLSEIGELAGYSHGLVSHRFGSKIALVRALTQADFMHHARTALEQRGGLDAVIAMAEAYLRAATSKPRNALYVLIGEAIGPVPEIRAEIADADRNFRGWVRTHIERGIESGEIRREIDAPSYAALLIGMLRGLTIQHLVDPHAFDVDHACRELRASIESRLKAASRRERANAR
jgi:AcrR family transcriptional regulator